MKLHYLLPLFHERCPICETYAEHEHGTIDLPVPMGPVKGPVDVTTIPSIPTEQVSVTRCRTCGWATRY